MENDKKAIRDSSQAVYEAVKREIILGERRPGEVFNEKELAASMGLSRTPVREAVLRLADEGLLDIKPRRGTFVSYISLSEVRDMYQVRRMLEPQIAAAAAKGCDRAAAQEWKLFFEGVLATGEENGDFPKRRKTEIFPDSDALFHIFLAESTGNRLLVRESEMLMTLTQRIRCLSNAIKRERFLSAVEEHIEIINALLSGDGERAARAVTEHLENSEKGYAGMRIEGVTF